MEVYVDSIKICQRNNDHTTTIILQKNKREREKEREREREREREKERKRKRERERKNIFYFDTAIDHTTYLSDDRCRCQPAAPYICTIGTHIRMKKKCSKFEDKMGLGSIISSRPFKGRKTLQIYTHIYTHTLDHPL